MTAREIQELVDSFCYWDARVVRLDSRHFIDEIEMAYDAGEYDVTYNFIGCYKANFDHCKNYDKLRPLKEAKVGQIPYFLQNVEVGETVEEGIHFLTCRINMFPLTLNIWFKDIKISKEKKQETH